MFQQPVILLTGGSSGIGLKCLELLAKDHPQALIINGSRTAPPVAFPGHVKHVELDLSSRDSVRSFATGWKHGEITHFIANAGIKSSGRPKYTKEGIELSFAINHLHHALLFLLLNEKGAIAEECRMVFVTSALHDPLTPLGHQNGSPIWLGAEGVAKSKDEQLQADKPRYPNSKLAVILFAYALERRAREGGKKGWHINAFEPGFCPGQGSQLSRDAPPEVQEQMNNFPADALKYIQSQGVVTTTPIKAGRDLASLATDEKWADVSGKYVFVDYEKKSSVDSLKVELQDDLWEWTVNELASDAAEKKRFESLSSS